MLGQFSSRRCVPGTAWGGVSPSDGVGLHEAGPWRCWNRLAAGHIKRPERANAGRPHDDDVGTGDGVGCVCSTRLNATITCFVSSDGLRVGYSVWDKQHACDPDVVAAKGWPDRGWLRAQRRELSVRPVLPRDPPAAGLGERLWVPTGRPFKPVEANHIGVAEWL